MAKEQVARLTDISIGRRDMPMMSPKDIKIEKGFNPRDYRLPENHAHLDFLKESIKINGVRVPLQVRFDVKTKEAVLVDGECRLRAVLELIEEGLKIEAVPTMQVPGNNPEQRLISSLTANTGKPLSKWEVGAAFQRLFNFGWDPAKIAGSLGFPERYIKEAMELTDAPDEIKQLLSERAVTPALALDHLRKSGEGAIMTLRSSAAEAQSAGKKTAKRAKKAKTPSAEPPKSDADVLLGKVRKMVMHEFEEAGIKTELGKFCEKLLDLIDGKEKNAG